MAETAKTRNAGKKVLEKLPPLRNARALGYRKWKGVRPGNVLELQMETLWALVWCFLNFWLLGFLFPYENF